MANIFKDYEGECILCDKGPTVIVGNHQTKMCGVCCFGEAKMVDPEEWPATMDEITKSAQ